MIVLDEGCSAIFSAVSAFAEVIIFRRSRGFLSDPRIAAEELSRLARATVGEAGVIYVAQSFAASTGLYAAAKYPRLIDELVLLDPSHPRQGIVALEALESEPSSPEIEQLREFFKGFGPVWDAACEEILKIRTIGDIRLVVIGAGRLDIPDQVSDAVKARMKADRLNLMKEYSELSSRGCLTILEDSGHNLVCDARQEVVSIIHGLIRDRR